MTVCLILTINGHVDNNNTFTDLVLNPVIHYKYTFILQPITQSTGTNHVFGDIAIERLLLLIIHGQHVGNDHSANKFVCTKNVCLIS